MQATADKSHGRDARGTPRGGRRFRITIAQMLWLAALCALASGFVAQGIRSSEAQRPFELAFSPDGRLLAANFVQGGILVWDVSDGRPRRIGAAIETGEDWGIMSPSIGAHLQFAGPDKIGFAPWDLSTGSAWGYELWDVRQRKAVGTLPLGAVPGYGEVFSPDGRFLAMPSLPRRRIDLIEVKSGRLVRSIPMAEFAQTIAFSADGERLVTIEQTLAEVFRVKDGRRESVATIPGVDGEPGPVGGKASESAISPDGRCLALLEYRFEEPQQGKLHIIDADGKGGSSIEGPFYSNVCFLSASLIAVDTVEGVEIWDVLSKKRLRILDTPPVIPNGLAAAPDGSTLVIAEEDRISLWDVRTGKHLGDVWVRHASLEVILFSVGFIGWAVVWGLMRRRPKGLPPPDAIPATGAATTGLHAEGKRGGRTIALNFVGVFGLLSLVGAALVIPWAFAAAQALGGATVLGLLAALGVLLLGPFGLIMIVTIVLLTMKLVFHSHGAELRRAAAVAQAPCRTADFGRITAYFFGGSTLDATFEQDLATVRSRLAELLGDVAEPPHLPVFCFERQDQFNAYLARTWPLGGVYSPPWWARQIVMCERPACGIADPREVLRTLLSYALLWNHKGFRVPWWITTVVNAHSTYGDDAANLARAVHRRLKAELQRSGELAPLPHTLGVEQFTRLVLARDQREAFFTQSLLGDICASLAAYLMGDDDRRRKFRELLRGLTRRSDLDDAFRQHFGRSLNELMDDWLVWLREQIADPTLDEHAALPEAVRRQILKDFVPLLLDSAADLEARCRAARSLGDAGWLLGAEALIEVLDTGAAELQQDALWALEAISGRRLGNDAAAWRQWFDETSQAAEPAIAATVLPDDAALADEKPAGAAPVDSAPIDSARDAQPKPASRPLLVAPRGLVTCWTFMVLGGAFAIFLSALFLFEMGLVWWPMLYYSVAMGVFAIVRGVGRHTRRLPLVGLLQMLNLLNFDPVNPLFGIVLLIACRTRRVREYLATQNSSD